MRTTLSTRVGACTLGLMLCMSCAEVSSQSFEATTAKESLVDEGELATRLGNYLAVLEGHGFSGGVLVARQGKILFNKAYGLAVRETDVPNEIHTLHSTGSITKQFTSAAILKLEMMGKLRTSDSIRLYFDEVPSDKAAITLHHLLTHTSGLQDYVFKDRASTHVEEAVAKILRQPLLFEPGTQWRYNNSGYNMLSAVIEKVSGESYETFVKTHLFEPAQMLSSGYSFPASARTITAHQYSNERDHGSPLRSGTVDWFRVGAGGILTTTADMFKWHMALMENAVLSKAAKQKLYTPFLNGYAYGWYVADSPHGRLVRHDGGSPRGNGADIRRYLDRDVMIMVFTNRTTPTTGTLGSARRDIIKLVFGEPVSPPVPVQLLSQSELEKYRGIYMFPSGDRFEVSIEQDGLSVLPVGTQAFKHLYFTDDAVTADSLRTLTEKTKTVVEAIALHQNYEPYTKVVNNPDTRLWKMVLEQNKARVGEIKEVVLASLKPTEVEGLVEGEGIPGIEVGTRIIGETGELAVRMTWVAGIIEAIQLSRELPQTYIRVKPVGGHQFLEYHLGSGRARYLHFQEMSDGARLALQFEHDGRSVVVPKAN